MPVTENVKRSGLKHDWGAIGEQYPLLVERDREYGFGPPSGAPWDDNVTVWRLPPINNVGGGLLYLPENLDSPNVVGVLVAWGMKAQEQLQSQGISLGHYVVWERFAGWEADDATPEIKRCSRFLKLRARQILESQDVQAKLLTGEISYVTGDDGRVRMQQNLLPEVKSKKRAAKLKAVANDPSASAQERETANKILNRKK